MEASIQFYITLKGQGVPNQRSVNLKIKKGVIIKKKKRENWVIYDYLSNETKAHRFLPACMCGHLVIVVFNHWVTFPVALKPQSTLLIEVALIILY